MVNVNVFVVSKQFDSIRDLHSFLIEAVKTPRGDGIYTYTIARWGALKFTLDQRNLVREGRQYAILFKIMIEF